MIVEVDGQPVHARTGGRDPDGDDPGVVFLHGAGMDGSAWQLQTRFLAHHGYRPLAVDLPGHGRTPGPALESIEELADWLDRFVDALGWGPVHLVGHSMGTFIALQAAAGAPTRYRSLVLMATAESMPVHPELLAAAEDDLPRAAALVASWGHGRPAHVGPHPTPGLWMIGGARALIEASRPGVLATDFRACAAYGGATVAAEAVERPVTVVCGKADKMTPARSGRALAEHLSRSTIVELEGVGHMIALEDPGAVRLVLLAALG